MPPAIWALALGTGINQFGNVIPLFLALYLVSRKLSIAQAGLAVAVIGSTSLAASIIGGQLSDRIGARRVMISAMMTSAVFAVLLALARNFWLILLLVAAYGLASQMVRPAVGSILGSATVPSQRVVAAALVRLSLNAGSAAGPIVAGLMVEHSF